MFFYFQASVRLRQSPTCCRAVQRPHEPPSFGLAQNRDPDDQDEGRDEGEDRHEARVLLPHHRRVHHPAGTKFNDLTKYVMPGGRSGLWRCIWDITAQLRTTLLRIILL